MKQKFSSLFSGLILVLLGGFMFAQEMGYFRDLADQTWMLIFAAAGILFWIAYFVNGIQRWGWLFPACVFSALSGVMLLINTAIADEWIGTLIIGSMVVPLAVGYMLDRSRWVLLIPAFILGFTACIPPLTLSMDGEWLGMFVIGMIGLPFLAAYLASPKAWWALFPAGILLSIAVTPPISILRLGFDAESFAAGIMFLGWALTFGLAWLRRNLHPTAWAQYPAIGASILALLLFLVTAGLEMYWSISLIIAGGVLILLSLRPQQERLDA